MYQIHDLHTLIYVHDIQNIVYKVDMLTLGVQRITKLTVQIISFLGSAKKDK